MAADFRTRFLDAICPYRQYVFYLLVVNVALLVLVGFSALVGPQTDATRFVLLLDLVFVGLTLAGTGFVLVVCRGHY